MPFSSSKRLTALEFILGLLFEFSTPALPYRGDKADWSVITDYPSPRALLMWVPISDGPRALEFDCVPGNYLNIFSEDVEAEKAGNRATLTLVNGRARFDVEGELTRVTRSNETFFQTNVPLHGARERLLPIFEGPGPIYYKIGVGSMRNDMSGPTSPISVDGLSRTGRAFKAVCFGK
jgi:hypothetical protein